MHQLTVQVDVSFDVVGRHEVTGYHTVACATEFTTSHVASSLCSFTKSPALFSAFGARVALVTEGDVGRRQTIFRAAVGAWMNARIVGGLGAKRALAARVCEHRVVVIE